MREGGRSNDESDAPKKRKRKNVLLSKSALEGLLGEFYVYEVLA